MVNCASSDEGVQDFVLDFSAAVTFAAVAFYAVEYFAAAEDAGFFITDK